MPVTQKELNYKNTKLNFKKCRKYLNTWQTAHRNVCKTKVTHI